MGYKTLIAVLLATAATTPVNAQNIQLNGVSAEWGSIAIAEDGRELGQGTLKGTAEVGITEQFALGASLGYYAIVGDDLGTSVEDITSTSITVHGMYLPSPNTAIGVFAGTESTDDIDDNVNVVGLEFGALTQSSKFDVYYGITDLEFGDEEYTFGGFSIEFGRGQGWNGGFSYDAFSPVSIFVTDTGSFIEGRRTNYAFHAGYDFSNGIGLTGSLGRLGLSGEEGDTDIVAEDPQTYVGFSLNYNFGPKGGTFTDNRTLLGIF